MPRLAVFPKGFIDALMARRMTLPQWLDLAAELGVDGVELYPPLFDSFAPEFLREIRRRAESHGLAIPMLCHSPDFTQPQPEARRREVERARQMFQAASEMGAKYCRVLSGQNRPGLPPDEALKWVIEALQQLLPHAEKTGIVMVIENHYKDGLWEYPEFAQSSERFFAIVDAVDSPWLKIQYDPSNAIVAGEDAYALLERALPRLATVHASDRYLEGGTLADLRRMAADPQHGYARILKHGVIGKGLNDYDRIFSTLARAGFNGWISIEDGTGDTVEEGMANLHASAKFLKEKLDLHFGSAQRHQDTKTQRG